MGQFSAESLHTTDIYLFLAMIATNMVKLTEESSEGAGTNIELSLLTVMRPAAPYFLTSSAFSWNRQFPRWTSTYDPLNH